MDKTICIIDSGASAHVCCNKELLHTSYKFDRVVTVNLPNGSSKQVATVGKVKLNSHIVLSDVQIVPGFTHNLLSMAQLIHDNGVRRVCYQTHCDF